MKKLMIIIPLLMGSGLEPTNHWFGIATEKQYKKDNRYCKGKVRSPDSSDVWDKEHIDFLVYKACMKEKGYEWRNENDRDASDTAGDGDL